MNQLELSKQKIMNNSREDALSALVEILESNKAQPGEVTKLISDYPEHKDELNDLLHLWRSFDQVKVPKVRPEMDTAFYKMLSSQQMHSTGEKSHSIALSESIHQVVTWMIQPKRLAIAAAFALGIVFGKFVLVNESGMTDGALLATQTQIDPMNVLVNNGTAIERLETIHQTKTLDNPDDKIMEALYKALILDPNVNVRLSAIEAMARFADHPQVTQYLINSIAYQNSPIVQLELAELMIALEERGSAEAWQELLDSDDLEVEVKLQLKEKLATIL